MVSKKAAEIIKRYRKGIASEAEVAWLESWYLQVVGKRLNEEVLPDSQLKEAMWAYIQQHKEQTDRPAAKLPTRRTRIRLPYVAAAIFIAIVGTWIFMGELSTRKPINQTHADNRRGGDIAPGGNKATLTLADGKSITLDEDQEGIVVNGNNITYLDGASQVTALNESHSSAESFVLTTPKGGTYQLTLSDGTQVWLNAASTLTYPVRFDGKDRAVTLAGEAYFSVASDKSKPFRVTSKGQAIEVIGTEFNVHAYEDEEEAKTTLIKGAVAVLNLQSRKVNQIAPGQQAVVSGMEMAVQSVETVASTAWKNGLFYFKKTPLEDVMHQVSRWYDVDVVYRKGIPKETFSGEVKRNISLLGLLEILQVSNIDVSLVGNTLIVN